MNVASNMLLAFCFVQQVAYNTLPSVAGNNVAPCMVALKGNSLYNEMNPYMNLYMYEYYC